MQKIKLSLLVFLVLFTTLFLKPSKASACACGCGIFDVGTSLMLPNGAGGMVYLEYDFMNQNQNWHATHSASGNDSLDKNIKTHYTTLGGQYFFNRSFGIQVDIPYVSRHFETADPDSGTIGSFDHGSLGDIRVKGYYTGFSEDLSSGLSFGLKLPTGDTHASNFDFDTQNGTGSTDLLLGFYHMNALSEDRVWNAFWQVSLDQPMLTQNDYVPGNEMNAVYGVYYHQIGSTQLGFTPMLQAKASVRGSDHGVSGHPEDTGYTRLFISPAMEFGVGPLKLYADVSVPFYQYFAGNQLAQGYLLKTMVAYHF